MVTVLMANGHDYQILVLSKVQWTSAQAVIRKLMRQGFIPPLRNNNCVKGDLRWRDLIRAPGYRRGKRALGGPTHLFSLSDCASGYRRSHHYPHQRVRAPTLLILSARQGTDAPTSLSYQRVKGTDASISLLIRAPGDRRQRRKEINDSKRPYIRIIYISSYRASQAAEDEFLAIRLLYK